LSTGRVSSSSDRRSPIAITFTIDVQDTGFGIPATHLEDVFNAFFTTKPGGMGMGLSISRSIIEAPRGSAVATPNASHGVTFHSASPARPERPASRSPDPVMDGRPRESDIKVAPRA